MIVTAICVVYFYDHQLPEQRARLYRRCADIMLHERLRPDNPGLEQSGLTDSLQKHLSAGAALALLDDPRDFKEMVQIPECIYPAVAERPVYRQSLIYILPGQGEARSFLMLCRSLAWFARYYTFWGELMNSFFLTCFQLNLALTSSARATKKVSASPVQSGQILFYQSAPAQKILSAPLRSLPLLLPTSAEILSPIFWLLLLRGH